MAALGHALAVRVEEGRHFPRDAGAAFRVAAVFDDESASTVRRAFANACACALRCLCACWRAALARCAR
jgi:hypothetical protein